MRKKLVCRLTILALVSLVASHVDAQCNQVPVAADDYVEYFGQQIFVEPMLNDSEPNGEALTIEVVSQTCGNPAIGPPVVVQIENGTLRLLPTQPGYHTLCSVNYRIEDERGFTAAATIYLREAILFADGFESGTTNSWNVSTVTEPQGELR